MLLFILKIVVKKEKHYTVIAKVYPTSDEIHKNLKSKKLRVTLLLNNEGVQQNSYLDLPFDIYHSTKTKMNFSNNIKPIEILKVSGIEFVNK